MTQEEELYNESIELIKSNPDIRTDQIPEHLFKVWFYNGDPLEQPPKFEMLFSMSIYSFAKEQYIKLHPNHVNDKRYRDDSSLLPQNKFMIYQYLLALEYTRRVMGGFKPVKIFDFANYDKPIEVNLKKAQVKKFKKLVENLLPIKMQLGN